MNNTLVKDPLIKMKYGLIKNKLLGQFFTINLFNEYYDSCFIILCNYTNRILFLK